MGAFAVFLKQRGIHVTGTDENVYPPMSDVLGREGVRTIEGYDAKNLDRLDPEPTLYVIGNVIRPTNPEALEIQKRGKPFVSLPEFMEKCLLEKTRNLVVAGTHGK